MYRDNVRSGYTDHVCQTSVRSAFYGKEKQPYSPYLSAHYNYPGLYSAADFHYCDVPNYSIRQCPAFATSPHGSILISGVSTENYSIKYQNQFCQLENLAE